MRPKLFLDSTALIAAVITKSESSAIYRIIALGEPNVLDMRISREVIGDVERFVRARNSAMLPLMAQAITRGNIATTSEPNKETVDYCETLKGYRPDARILATAVESAADILVTHDKQHLLGNCKIKPPGIEVMVMTPQECLEWCFERWAENR